MKRKPSTVGLQRSGNAKLPGSITGKGFKPGRSGNPSGRRLGAVSPTAALRRALSRKDAENMARKVIDAAKAGDLPSLRFIFERLEPRDSEGVTVNAGVFTAPVPKSKESIDVAGLEAAFREIFGQQGESFPAGAE